MKTFPLSLILLILLARSAFPQDNTAAGQVTPVILRDSTPVSQRALWIWLAGQFKAADTVLLVSHRGCHRPAYQTPQPGAPDHRRTAQ